jgi:hyperosmotically inducible protein
MDRAQPRARLESTFFREPHARNQEICMKHSALAFIVAALVALAAPAHADKTAGNVVDDNTVNASVKAALSGIKGLPDSQINVETYKGVVLLAGFVETQAQKDQAGKAAHGVSGAKTVHNAIAITPENTMGSKLDDTVTTSKVKAALMDDKDVKSGQINVETKGGIVSLAGFVSRDSIKRRAVEVAKGVSGVKRVVDAMYVKPE